MVEGVGQRQGLIEITLREGVIGGDGEVERTDPIQQRSLAIGGGLGPGAAGQGE
jgi:hypothetical protein